MARPTTPLIGRRSEVERLTWMVLGGTRLVTVSGLGGVGKTRLVLEVVGRLADQSPPRATIHWCDTGNLASAEDLLWSLGTALGVELPANADRDPWLALASAMSGLPPHLVVLDALEGLGPAIGPQLALWLWR